MSNPDQERGDLLKPHLWLIALIGLIVPQRLRADWRQEWEAELRCREMMLAEWDRLNWQTKPDLLLRSTSAFGDALWLQPKRWEDEMIQDLRFGARMLLKHKGFTLIAVLSLALGIGANTAIFSLLDALLLKTLPVKQPEQLVIVGGLGYSHPDLVFQELSEKNSVFAGMFTFHSLEMTMSDGGQAERVVGEHEVRQLDPNLPVFNVKTFADHISESISRERLIALLSSFFGLFALLLVLIGIAIGLPVALAATRLTKGLLFGLAPNDPLTIALAALVLISIAALAGYLPARRAARVDPMAALRHE